LTIPFSFAKLNAMNMTLPEYLEKTGISNVDFARKIGVTPGMLSQWLSGHRPISPEKCVLIEKETAGQVTREKLRPNDFWLIWPDLKQPKIAA